MNNDEAVAKNNDDSDKVGQENEETVTENTCEICDESFVNQYTLENHMKCHDTIWQLDGNYEFELNTDKRDQPDEDLEGFVNYDAPRSLPMKEQCAKLLGNYVYCDLCDYQSTCEKSLNIHIEKIHINPKPKRRKRNDKLRCLDIKKNV